MRKSLPSELSETVSSVSLGRQTRKKLQHCELSAALEACAGWDRRQSWSKVQERKRRVFMLRKKLVLKDV